MTTDYNRVMCEYAGGSEEAFGDLYEHFSAKVRTFIRRCTPRELRSEVEDICQHFWLGLVRYRRTYNEEKPVEAWLLSMAHNAIASFYRLNCPRRSINTLSGRMEHFNETDDDMEQYDESDPELPVILAEDLALLDEAMGRLRPEYRDLLEGVYIREETPTEYAEKHGLPIGTISTHLRRAVEDLYRKASPALRCA